MQGEGDGGCVSDGKGGIGACVLRMKGRCWCEGGKGRKRCCRLACKGVCCAEKLVCNCLT